MMKQPRTPRKKSSFRRRVMLRLRHSWMRWRLKRIQKLLPRELREVTNLQLLLDNQLLRVKQLEQQQRLLQLMLEEQEEIRAFRKEGLLKEVPPSPTISQLLGQ